MSELKPQNIEDSDNMCPVEYVCDACGFYPILPVHGHFECPKCRYKTKCCEGM